MQVVASSERLVLVARAARAARVPMSHVPGDAEYLPVLAYRVRRERELLVARLASLASLDAAIASLVDGRES